MTMRKSAQELQSRLQTDFAALLGPNSAPGSSAGAIVIINALRQGYLPIKGGTSRNKVQLRSDQIAFIADSGATSWLAAGTSRPWDTVYPYNQNDPTQGLAGVSSGAGPIRSNQARIWLGAVDTGDTSGQAQNWVLGRQVKLIGRLMNDGSGNADPAYATPLGDLTLDSSGDLASGSLSLLADSVACGTQTLPGNTKMRGVAWRNLGTGSGSDWNTPNTLNYSGNDYITKLIGNYPNDQTNYTQLPSAANSIDLGDMRHSSKSIPSNPIPAGGLTLANLNRPSLQLTQNVSEIIVQFAADLDKDGNIDTYPPGHPLAGAIIWYPEDAHDNAQKDLVQGRFPEAMQTKYAAIKANPWRNTFPAGFTGPAAARFGGHGSQTASWYRDFEFDYGEVDGAGSPLGQTTAPGLHIPAPFVFRFEDDQYRLVPFGFRQDGGVYANRFTGTPLPMPGSSDIVTNHWFPFPPIPGATYNKNTCNPSMATLYASKIAPPGSWPKTAPTGALGTLGLNYGDQMGAQWFSGLTLQSLPFGSGPFRTKPSASYPNGQLLQVNSDWQRVRGVQPSPNGNYVMLAVAVGAAATGVETILAPSVAYRSEPMTGYPDGRVVSIVPSDEPGYGAGTVANTASDGTANFTNAGGAWFSIKLGAAATGTETQINVLACDTMVINNGPGNNYIFNYFDVLAPWYKAVSLPAKQGTLEDWRNPQSDWPKLIRIRVRLHDPQGDITTYTDEFQCNGRDDDGDGQVDMQTESRMSGTWFEYIFAVPYPRDPSPRNH